MKTLLKLLAILSSFGTTASAVWMDATDEAGLGRIAASVIKFSDINNDGFPDIIATPRKRPAPISVLLHEGLKDGTPVFKPFAKHGLPEMQTGDVIVFADLDNDGARDAILSRYLDLYQAEYQPVGNPARTAWFKGLGNGTFGPARELSSATMGTTRAIAVGDANLDGKPDLFLGNWYVRYFSGYEAFSNDLLLQQDAARNAFTRWPIPGETSPTTHITDGRGRPTYGTLICILDKDKLPHLLELNYGRRWNRLYELSVPAPLFVRDGKPAPEPFILQHSLATGQHHVRSLVGKDIASQAGIDGDNIRHGRHPKWPEHLASGHPRAKRPDEPPFRANGNTFDAAIGDIDNDGDFDLFVSTIIHAWAGESSDRSRFLVNQLSETGELKFLSFADLSVDRLPPLPEPGQPLELKHVNSNQGDIHAELADLDNDGRLDLILCSSDYADAPPFEERLRLFYQQEDGRFRDCTAESGIDHIGAGMPSLADVDSDGDLDLLIGQSFNRLTAEQRREAASISGALPPGAPEDARPDIRARLFLNTAPPAHNSIIIHLIGDPELNCTREAYHSLITVEADLDAALSTPEVTQIRQILGPGGHAGAESPPAAHIGIGKAQSAKVSVQWAGPRPPSDSRTQTFKNVTPGTYRLSQGKELERIHAH